VGAFACRGESEEGEGEGAEAALAAVMGLCLHYYLE
jgi:hypothetical protein